MTQRSLVLLTCLTCLTCLTPRVGAQSFQPRATGDPAEDQARAVALQKALDKTVDFTIADAPIGEVFARLSDKTGVRFILDDDVAEFLPYGAQTRLEVTMRNITLRKALDGMLRRQALSWKPDNGAIRILPSQPLYRMGRRATYDELQTLGTLFTARIEPTNKGGSPVEQMRKAVGNDDLNVFFSVFTDKHKAFERAEEALPASGADWLDMVCHGRDWVWYLWGDEIVIVEKAHQVRRQLQRPVSLEYKNAALTDVLLDLADRAKVKLRFAPGVLRLLSDETREHFNLIMSEATVEQALEVIAGATGLTFEYTADGVTVSASDTLRQATENEQPRKRPPFWVQLKIPVESGEVNVFLSPEELPEELVEKILAHKARFIADLQELPVPTGPDARIGTEGP